MTLPLVNISFWQLKKTIYFQCLFFFIRFMLVRRGLVRNSSAKLKIAHIMIKTDKNRSMFHFQPSIKLTQIVRKYMQSKNNSKILVCDICCY